MTIVAGPDAVSVGAEALTEEMIPDIEPESSSVVPVPFTAAQARRAVLVAVVTVLALIVLYAFFAAVLEPVWYQSRQSSFKGAAASVIADAGFTQATSSIPSGQWVAVVQSSGVVYLNTAVVQGDGSSQLKEGPGHAVSTPMPGSIGNSVIFGRSSEWGGPLGPLAKATVGTTLYVKDRVGTTLAYEVTEIHRVPSGQVAKYLAPSTDYRLTFVTDAADRFSDSRLVVIAVSGSVGRLEKGRSTVSEPPGPGLASSGIPLFLDWAAGALAVGILLRKRYSAGAVAAVFAVPAATALFFGFAALDLFWSPLS